MHAQVVTRIFDDLRVRNADARAKAANALTGSCHNCFHLKMTGLGGYDCLAPVPKSIAQPGFRDIITPGETTIINCPVWKAK